MSESIAEVLERVGKFFMGESPIQKAARRITQTLDAMGIPYAIAGALAVNVHGHRRTTEDVDLFIERLSLSQFTALYNDLLTHGFWSVTVDDPQELFSMLMDRLYIRFAESEKVIPNFELKFVKDPLDRYALQNAVTVVLPGGELRIAPLDMQIAYKRFVLMSQKDLEDARHLQSTFTISEENINKCKQLLQQYGRI